MDNSGLLASVNKIVGELNELLKKYSKEDYNLTQIDIDLLKEKTRHTYDLLLKLSTPSVEDTSVLVKKEAFQDLPSETEIINKLEEEEVIESETEKVEEINTKEISTPEIIHEEGVEMEETSLETKLNISSEKEETEDPILEVEEELVKPIPEREITESTNSSSIDLFSESSVGEKFEEKRTIVEKISEEQKVESVGDKIKKDKISGLKNAIGINEKFYFINELFGGDMKMYNEAIANLDNLNDFASGVQLLDEYRAKHEWKEDNDAFVQLSNFINRKYK
jgi:hypothetical protein